MMTTATSSRTQCQVSYFFCCSWKFWWKKALTLPAISAVFCIVSLFLPSLSKCVCMCLCVWPPGMATIAHLQMRPDISLSAATWITTPSPPKFHKGGDAEEQHTAGHQPPPVTSGHRPRGPGRLSWARGKERGIERERKKNDVGSTRQGQNSKASARTNSSIHMHRYLLFLLDCKM